jgi:hypothetical protein
MLLIAILAKLGVDIIPGLKDNVILSFLVSAVFYTIIIALISNYFPILFGMDKESLGRVKVKLISQTRVLFGKVRRR